MKKKVHGTLDTWSMSHLSQQTSVLYCRLSDFKHIFLSYLFSKIISTTWSFHDVLSSQFLTSQSIVIEFLDAQFINTQFPNSLALYLLLFHDNCSSRGASSSATTIQKIFVYAISKFTRILAHWFYIFYYFIKETTVLLLRCKQLSHH